MFITSPVSGPNLVTDQCIKGITFAEFTSEDKLLRIFYRQCFTRLKKCNSAIKKGSLGLIGRHFLLHMCMFALEDRSLLSGDMDNALNIPDVNTKAPLDLVLISNMYFGSLSR